MAHVNCWEFKKCGQEGKCPASTFEAADGYLGGKNGGRGCVYITGTFCNKRIQGTYQDKEKNCAECEFYWQLKKAHGAEMSVIRFGRYVKSRADLHSIEKFLPVETIQ